MDPNKDFSINTSTARKAIEKLDMLLLCIESIDVNASQEFLVVSEQLHLKKYFPNYVIFWKSRCHNPMRKATTNEKLSLASFEALIVLISSMSERYSSKIRELISSRTPSSFHNSNWEAFSVRFSQLISERMNIRREAVQNYLRKINESNQFCKDLVITLALSSGKSGVKRLRTSVLNIF
ncbi:DUF3038 domain-containing protein [Prochlorococcus marinus]|uniref:DUF3038 domain-containing protein n=1 Tax=Prochlorococcus marinus TaxID=1219 RepID=UPI0022B5994B|nr:DUF3038 domain-containing protein [Prochlorococcus marinus]